MELEESDCLERAASAGHGVLATVHATRGVDAVPVVFAFDARRILIPVDSVKPKRSLHLQRVRNIKADPRCVLLVEHYSDEWDSLWWVRIHAEATMWPEGDIDLARATLAERHRQYRDPGSVEDVIALRPLAITGWSAR